MSRYYLLVRDSLIGVVAGLSLLSGQVVATDDEVQISEISGDPDNPRRHFRLRNPADLTPEDAERVYALFSGGMREGYAASGRAVGYQIWRRHNTAPYLSATHGNKYINNYSNATGEGYGDYEEAGRLPTGAVIAKDSFSVTESGEILLGPLFLMQKMSEGFNYVSGDWKYIQIQPDGSLFGETNGQNSERVEYCIGCHLAQEAQDHLYFVPEEYRQ